jgi:hypothetical protein
MRALIGRDPADSAVGAASTNQGGAETASAEPLRGLWLFLAFRSARRLRGEPVLHGQLLEL